VEVKGVNSVGCVKREGAAPPSVWLPPRFREIKSRIDHRRFLKTPDFSSRSEMPMNRAINVLVVMVAAVLGLWGCAQGGGSSEKVRALESKCAKLEDDYRAVASARDQFRKKLALAEDERNELRKEVELFQTVVKERDDLRTQLAARIGERDQL